MNASLENLLQKFTSEFRFCLLLIFILCFNLNYSTTLIVPTDYPNIQEGIDASVSGDTVLVLDGVYTGEGNYEININTNNQPFFLLSESGPSNCIIDCQGLGRGIYTQGDSLIISGFTIKNGFSNYGAGIYSFLAGYNTQYKNCTIVNNIATASGGGIYVDMLSHPKLYDSIISGNESPIGAGVKIGGWSDITIYNSIITDGLSSGPEGGWMAFYTCFFNGGPPTDSTVPIPPLYIFEANPLFIDPDNFNFQLQLESPCINAGSPYSPLDPDGTQNDIGPHFYNLNLLGDLNFDEIINVLDIVLCIGIILEEIESYNAQLWAADYNEDLGIDVLDIVLLVSIIIN